VIKKLLILFLVFFCFQQNVFAGINLIYGYDPRYDLQFKESGTLGMYNSDSTFFYGLEYQSPINESLSYSVGGVNTSARPLKSFSSGGSFTNLSNANSSFSYTTLRANLIYKVWGPFSVFGGLNYPLFISVNKGSGGPDVSLNGNFGYQYGFNVVFFDYLQFEWTAAEYLNFSGKNNANGAIITDGELFGDPTFKIRGLIQIKLLEVNRLLNLF